MIIKRYLKNHMRILLVLFVLILTSILINKISLSGNTVKEINAVSFSLEKPLSSLSYLIINYPSHQEIKHLSTLGYETQKIKYDGKEFLGYLDKNIIVDISQINLSEPPISISLIENGYLVESKKLFDINTIVNGLNKGKNFISINIGMVYPVIKKDISMNLYIEIRDSNDKIINKIHNFIILKNGVSTKKEMYTNINKEGKYLIYTKLSDDKYEAISISEFKFKKSLMPFEKFSPEFISGNIYYIVLVLISILLLFIIIKKKSILIQHLPIIRIRLLLLKYSNNLRKNAFEEASKIHNKILSLYEKINMQFRIRYPHIKYRIEEARIEGSLQKKHETRILFPPLQR